MGRWSVTKEGYPVYYEDWTLGGDMGSHKPPHMTCDEWEDYCIRTYGCFLCSASYGLDEMLAKLGLGGRK